MVVFMVFYFRTLLFANLQHRPLSDLHHGVATMDVMGENICVCVCLPRAVRLSLAQPIFRIFIWKFNCVENAFGHLLASRSFLHYHRIVNRCRSISTHTTHNTHNTQTNTGTNTRMNGLNADAAIGQSQMMMIARRRRIHSLALVILLHLQHFNTCMPHIRTYSGWNINKFVKINGFNLFDNDDLMAYNYRPMSGIAKTTTHMSRVAN